MHLAPSALTEAIGLLDFWQPVGSAFGRRMCARRIRGNRSGFLAVLAATRLRSSGPYERIRAGLQLAARR